MDKRKLLEVNEDIIFFSFRYCLGRKTYVVSMMVDELIKQWPNLMDSTKSKIQSEIKQAIDLGDAGWDCDVEQWNKILDLTI